MLVPEQRPRAAGETCIRVVRYAPIGWLQNPGLDLRYQVQELFPQPSAVFLPTIERLSILLSLVTNSHTPGIGINKVQVRYLRYVRVYENPSNPLSPQPRHLTQPLASVVLPRHNINANAVPEV